MARMRKDILLRTTLRYEMLLNPLDMRDVSLVHVGCVLASSQRSQLLAERKLPNLLSKAVGKS